jgi:RNA polymerase sigma-70 factor (ECF subfamily)
LARTSCYRISIWDDAFRQLPDVQRDVIILFYFEDQNVEEVSRALNLPENTVKSHLRRARQALAAMLEKK